MFWKSNAGQAASDIPSSVAGAQVSREVQVLSRVRPGRAEGKCHKEDVGAPFAFKKCGGANNTQVWPSCVREKELRLPTEAEKNVTFKEYIFGIVKKVCINKEE